MWELFIGGIVVAGLGGFWWYRRRALQRAREPKCPVCRSRHLEGVKGEMGSGTAVLGEEFQCLDCGLEPTELDASTCEIVDALRDLQHVEGPLTRLKWQIATSALRGKRTRMTSNRLDELERDVTDVWKSMQRVCDEYPDAFDVSVDGRSAQTAGGLLNEQLQEGGTGGEMILHSLFEMVGHARVFEQRNGAAQTLETVRDSLASEVERRRRESTR